MKIQRYILNRRKVRKILTFCLTIALCLIINVTSDSDSCGTIISQEEMVFEYNHSIRVDVNTINKIDYPMRVCIYAHIIKSSNDDTEIINETQLINQIEFINKHFNKINIHFEICKIDFHEHDDLYNFSVDDEKYLEAFSKPNALNVYYVNSLKVENVGKACGYTYYPYFKKNFIILNTFCSTNPNTFIHELGHFMGLYHTHEKVFGKEVQDGTNCQYAGDLICDTQADDGTIFSLTNDDCEYVGKEIEINNICFVPPIYNFMSYSKKKCRNEFTIGQYNKMVHNYCQFKTELISPRFGIKFKVTNHLVKFKAYGGTSYCWPNGDTTSSTVMIDSLVNPNFSVEIYTNKSKNVAHLTYSDYAKIHKIHF